MGSGGARRKRVGAGGGPLPGVVVQRRCGSVCTGERAT